MQLEFNATQLKSHTLNIFIFNSIGFKFSWIEFKKLNWTQYSFPLDSTSLMFSLKFSIEVNLIEFNWIQLWKDTY
jgi:hypothetical protein